MIEYGITQGIFSLMYMTNLDFKGTKKVFWEKKYTITATSHLDQRLVVIEKKLVFQSPWMGFIAKSFKKAKINETPCRVNAFQ